MQHIFRLPSHLLQIEFNLKQDIDLMCHHCRKEHEKCEFEVHEVYAVDVLISTGEGKVFVILSSLDIIVCVIMNCRDCLQRTILGTRVILRVLSDRPGLFKYTCNT